MEKIVVTGYGVKAPKTNSPKRNNAFAYIRKYK